MVSCVNAAEAMQWRAISVWGVLYNSVLWMFLKESSKKSKIFYTGLLNMPRPFPNTLLAHLHFCNSRALNMFLNNCLQKFPWSGFNNICLRHLKTLEDIRTNSISLEWNAVYCFSPLWAAVTATQSIAITSPGSTNFGLQRWQTKVKQRQRDDTTTAQQHGTKCKYHNGRITSLRLFY